MPRSCCGKPVVRIIKVADFEAGLIGLDQALHNAHRAGLDGEEEVKKELLRLIRAFGNYVSPSRESDYEKALWREYMDHVANLGREAKQESANSQKH